MPAKSIFRQPGAQHFQVVYRSQRDPRIHDEEASKHVLKPVQRGNLGKSRAELEHSITPSDLAHDKNRANIGEAATYGIYFDDTDYDYMRHLKPVGLHEDGVNSIWVEAPANTSRGKPDTQSLFQLPEGTLASNVELPRDYEAQRSIPSSISGFRLDMDPHLRQVLEALEDDAFVDGELEDDFFGNLIADGERGAHEDVRFEFFEEGLSNGADVDPHKQIRVSDTNEEDQSWEARFARFKQQKQPSGESASDLDTCSEGGDTIGSLPHISVIGGKKRRKAASDASGYSMSSSSMWRNEQLSVLDERFDQIQREYESSEEEEEASLGDLDEAPDLIASREDFESMMDDFLENYEVIAGKMRPILPGTATEKLDTVRKALGEAKIRDAEGRDSEAESILMPSNVDEKKDRWDCETILTTYSTLENHPRLIRAKGEAKVDSIIPKIRLDSASGLPFTVETFKTPKSVTNASATDDPEEEVLKRSVPATIVRSKNETADEKKARKHAVKVERQARRQDKKTTKDKFSKDLRQQSQSLVQKEQSKMRKL